MPLIFEKQIGTAKKIGVWEITEPIDFFLEQVILQTTEGISKKRLTEQVVSAHLLNTLAGKTLNQFLTKDEYGKPYLVSSETSVSFSHSRRMVACIIDHSGLPVGIDIEERRESIKTIAHKFVKKEEGFESGNIDIFHTIWGAKEVLFKIYSKKELDFLNHLTVEYQNVIKGHIHKNTYKATYQLEREQIDNFILVWNI